jgi:hypothetical protein
LCSFFGFGALATCAGATFIFGLIGSSALMLE